MNYYVEPIVLNTDDKKLKKASEDLYRRRQDACSNHCSMQEPEVSIVVLGYNRIEKTKRCVEAIIKYTVDINYEMILIDNGSTDTTYDFFQSVPIVNKSIIKVTKNLGANFVSSDVIKIFKGKYYVSVPNDIVVTENWLSNILKCYESDPTIGLAVPISTNISNLQQPDKTFDNLQQIFRFGTENNVSNALRWKQRMRVVTPIAIQRREVMELVGSLDSGFLHDFAEDDLCIRIRRAGYKIMLCEDCFVHHDHDFWNLEEKNAAAYIGSLEIGREDYQNKYYGLDAWDDVNNYEIDLINMLDMQNISTDSPQILGVDVRMGTPILEIKNKLKENNIIGVESKAFTTEAKYFLDLQTICGDNVYCDRIDYIFEHFAPSTFNYIILGEPLNSYPYPIKILQRLIELLKDKGQLLIKIKNLNNISKFSEILGGNRLIDDSLYANITPEDICNCANLIGIEEIQVGYQLMNIDKKTLDIASNILINAKQADNLNQAFNSLQKENYLFRIIK